MVSFCNRVEMQPTDIRIWVMAVGGQPSIVDRLQALVSSQSAAQSHHGRRSDSGGADTSVVGVPSRW